jgi:hypothetical protein
MSHHYMEEPIDYSSRYKVEAEAKKVRLDAIAKAIADLAYDDLRDEEFKGFSEALKAKKFVPEPEDDEDFGGA